MAGTKMAEQRFRNEVGGMKMAECRWRIENGGCRRNFVGKL